MRPRTIFPMIFFVFSAFGGDRVPPIGLQLSAADKTALLEGVTQLGGEIARLPPTHSLLPEVKIFHKAVDWAVSYQEFYRTNEVPIAYKLIEQGLGRARALA